MMAAGGSNGADAGGDEIIDLFVSYAHSDNEVPRGAEAGWVSTLIGELEKLLRRKLGGKGARIWRDGELAPNAPVTEELLRRVSASRVLLLVLSPGYCLSPWCQRELATFAARAEAAGQAHNLFVIEIEPVAREQWPAPLAPLTPTRFWTPAGQPPVPQLAGFPQPRSDEDLYWTSVNTLAHLIAERLRAAPAPGSVRPKPPVVLAEVTDDLEERRQALAATLAQRGDVVVLPARAYPRDNGADFEAAVASDLRAAALFVQVLGPLRGRVAPGTERSFVAIQAGAALRRGVPMLQWRPPDLALDSVADAAYRDLLAGEAVTSRGFEAFRLEVLQAVDRIVQPPSAPAAPLRRAPEAATGFAVGAAGPGLAAQPGQTGAPAEGLALYLQATPEDRAAAEQVADRLCGIGATVLLSPEPDPGQSFEQGLAAQEQALRQCHGVLLLYGRSPARAVEAAFLFVRRVFGVRRTGVWSAVLDLPPADKPRIPLRSPNLLDVDCRQGFDPKRLEGFFVALRGSAAAAGHA